MRDLLLSFGILVLVAGCGASRETGAVSTSRNILTADEIAKTSAFNAYDAVRLRRPAFLSPAVTSGAGQRRPPVYVDGIYFGEVESLKDIQVIDVKEIRYIDSRDATTLYGTGYVAGVIMVITTIH
jgi:hypothetical protein